MKEEVKKNDEEEEEERLRLPEEACRADSGTTLIVCTVRLA